MICKDYHLIFPQSNRWIPWGLFEEEIASSEDLNPYFSERPLEEYEPYFHRAQDYSIYDPNQFSHREGNAMFAFEDLDMRKSILYRTQRRRLVNTGLNANSEAVIELFRKERKAAAEAYVWAATPKPIDRYEEYEGVIYTYTQHLIDGYFEEEFGRYTEDLRCPSADAYNNWGHGTLMAGWPSDALGILQSALEIDFESSYVWHTLSQTYEALGLESKMKWAMDEYKKIKSDK